MYQYQHWEDFIATIYGSEMLYYMMTIFGFVALCWGKGLFSLVWHLEIQTDIVTALYTGARAPDLNITYTQRLEELFSTTRDI